MTVIASPADVLPTSQSGPGRGQSLLNGIAAVQTLVTAAANPAVQSALVQQLNLLQIEAVDYFMNTFWVSADQILAQMTNKMILPKAGDKYVTQQLADIAARLVQLNTPGNVGIQNRPPGGTLGQQPNGPQYSVSYPAPNSAYPLTAPDVVWYARQVQLVDYCMNKAILPASLILSTMTGTQTYPFNYISNYTTYQPYLSSDAFA